MLLVRWIGLRHKNKNIVTNDLISDILTCLARVVVVQGRKMSLKQKTYILCRQMQSDYQQNRIELISTETQYQQENKHRVNSAESCYQHKNGVTPEEDHRVETGRSLR